MSVIIKEWRDFRRDNKGPLDDIKGEINNINFRLEEKENRVVLAETRIQNTEDVLMELLKLHTKMREKFVDVEGRSRRNNIRIYGVPKGEEKDYPMMAVFLEKFLIENFNLPEDVPLQI